MLTRPPRRASRAQGRQRIVSSGPFIEASVEGKGPGETARGVGGKALLKLRIRAAPWVSVSKLEVYEGGKPRIVHNGPNLAEPEADSLRANPGNSNHPPHVLVVVVRGDVPLPNVARESTLPFAFTNPIWVEP